MFPVWSTRAQKDVLWQTQHSDLVIKHVENWISGILRFITEYCSARFRVPGKFDKWMEIEPVITFMWVSDTVNQQILAAIKFGVSQNKVIWRLLNLASPRGPSMQCTIDIPYILVLMPTLSRRLLKRRQIGNWRLPCIDAYPTPSFSWLTHKLLQQTGELDYS